MPGFLYHVDFLSALLSKMYLEEKQTSSRETAAVRTVYIPMSIAVTKAISSHIIMTFYRKNCLEYVC